MRAGIVIGVLAALVLSVAAGAPAASPGETPPVDPGGAEATVLWAEACDVVLSEVLNGTTEGRWVYADPVPVPAGTAIETWYGSVRLPGEPGWVFFIDDLPGGNWGHPCRYVFVDDLGWALVQDALGPPPDLQRWQRLAECGTDPGAGPGGPASSCIAVGDRVLSWHQRTLDDAVVEGDYVLAEYDRAKLEPRGRTGHWRTDLPDTAVPVVTAERARPLVRGTVTSTVLYLLSPGSSRFPVAVPPPTPCWVVRSEAQGIFETTVVDGMDGTVLGTESSSGATVTPSATATRPPSSATPTVRAPGPAGAGALAALLAAALCRRGTGRAGRGDPRKS